MRKLGYIIIAVLVLTMVVILLNGSTQKNAQNLDTKNKTHPYNATVATRQVNEFMQASMDKINALSTFEEKRKFVDSLKPETLALTQAWQDNFYGEKKQGTLLKTLETKEFREQFSKMKTLSGVFSNTLGDYATGSDKQQNPLSQKGPFLGTESTR